MRILVTGGAGFIGSNLCESLLDQGHDVICLDNFFTGNKKNIIHLLPDPNFELLRHDITFPTHVECDQIYNLACPASPIHYQFDPIKTIQTSTTGMVNMLELASQVKAKILQTSTSEIYGNPLEHPQKESYLGNVNCIGPRSCFSEDTEILTQDGWKFFNNLSKNDKLLTLNSDGLIEYCCPIEIIKQKYSGDMILFKNKKIDLLVTPNHKMYTRRRGRKKFEFIEAKESIEWNRAEMQKSARWEGKEVEWFYIPKVKNSKFGNIEKIPMDLWLEFFGYYITEGCIYFRRRIRDIKGKDYNAIDYNVLIAQKPGTKNWQKIKSCLEKMPFTFFDSDDHQFRICNKQLAVYLKKFGKSYEKHIPKELKSLSKRQLRILFDALMLGDGSKDKRAFYTNSIKLAGDIQEIALKISIASNINTMDKRKEKCVFHLNFLNNQSKDFLTPEYPKRKYVQYTGIVYCVNVPNHVIYVRRNGKVVFCGNCYDEGKRVAESLMFAYHWQNKVDIKIARIFNTYGPKMSKFDGRVISNFIVQALEDKPITVNGDGSQTRSFCYVSDMVEGLVKLMNSNGFVGPVNLGNPEEMTILEMANKIIKLTDSKSEIVFRKMPQDDPEKRRPDISLAKEKLGWQPTVGLDDGLKKTIEYFKNNHL